MVFRLQTPELTHKGFSYCCGPTLLLQHCCEGSKRLLTRQTLRDSVCAFCIAPAVDMLRPCASPARIAGVTIALYLVRMPDW